MRWEVQWQLVFLPQIFLSSNFPSHSRFGYATLKNTIIEQIEVKGEGGMVKRPKMRIVLTKSADFNKLMDKAEAIKKENEAVYNLIGSVSK